MRCSAYVAFLFVFMGSDFASAQWGALSGRVVLEGKAPDVPPLVKGPARGVVGNIVVPDDSLVIDPETKGIANVAVWLTKKPDRIHDDLLEALPEVVTMNLVGFRFEPHLLVVHTSQQVEFVNLDLVNHNVHPMPIKNQTFNQIVPPNNVNQLMHFQLAERLPIIVNDDIHPWMKAYLLVVDHPYAAVTDTDGTFFIPNLPVGEHEFKIWHERVGYLVKDAVNPKKSLIVKITDGEPTVVPEIKVPVKTLTDAKK